MSVGNLKDNGNKGNNFPYQFKNLNLLSAINECCGDSGNTLTQILYTLQNGQNYVQLLVQDANGDLFSEVRIWNGTSFDPPIYYNADGSVGAPAFPVIYVNPAFQLSQIVLLLSPESTRVHNTVSATGVGSVPAGSMRGSVINVGNAAGTWNGISLPAGVSIPWDAIANRDTYGTISYDATGTTFIIEYTT